MLYESAGTEGPLKTLIYDLSSVAVAYGIGGSPQPVLLFSNNVFTV